MQKSNHEYVQYNPQAVERSPLVIACEQTDTQRVQMKMDELFHSSPRVPVYDEPTVYASEETLELKKTTARPSTSRRRISTNSAAGRSKRLELEKSTKVNQIRSKSINPLSSQTMKLTLVAVLASLFRT